MALILVRDLVAEAALRQAKVPALEVVPKQVRGLAAEVALKQVKVPAAEVVPKLVKALTPEAVQMPVKALALTRKINQKTHHQPIQRAATTRNRRKKRRHNQQGPKTPIVMGQAVKRPLKIRCQVQMNRHGPHLLS